jgi:hypothetical protein
MSYKVTRELMQGIRSPQRGELLSFMKDTSKAIQRFDKTLKELKAVSSTGN